LVSSNATSKASLAVLVMSPGMRWLSLIVNWRVLAPVGMMKAWVSSESFWDCSVSVAVPLMMLVAPRVFQVVGVVKSPLVMPMRAPAVRFAVVLSCWLVVSLLLQRVLRIDLGSKEVCERQV
jgi:hypothetical protein